MKIRLKRGLGKFSCSSFSTCNVIKKNRLTSSFCIISKSRNEQFTVSCRSIASDPSIEKYQRYSHTPQVPCPAFLALLFRYFTHSRHFWQYSYYKSNPVYQWKSLRRIASSFSRITFEVSIVLLVACAKGRRNTKKIAKERRATLNPNQRPSVSDDLSAL